MRGRCLGVLFIGLSLAVSTPFAQEAPLGVKPIMSNPMMGSPTLQEVCFQPGACYPGSMQHPNTAVGITELIRVMRNGNSDQSALLNAVIARLDANTNAVNALAAQLVQSDQTRYSEFMGLFAENVMAMIDAIPAELARDEKAYETLKSKLIADMKELFDLQEAQP